jgi:hypothetical protein
VINQSSESATENGPTEPNCYQSISLRLFPSNGLAEQHFYQSISQCLSTGIGPKSIASSNNQSVSRACVCYQGTDLWSHSVIEQSLYVTREWVSSATVMWMMKELIENDAAHPDLTQVIYIYILFLLYSCP